MFNQSKCTQACESMIFKCFLLYFIFHSIVCDIIENEEIIEKLTEEWHVTTLRSTDFHENTCDNIAKPEKQIDAALIEFVSSDPLPFNESDLIQNMCITNKHSARTKLIKNTNSEKINTIFKATTEKEKQKNGTTDSRRVHDYQFSSIEYYDEHPDFDEYQCPDDVEIVVLELDELRSYDLECELIIEWRSLE